MNLRLWIVCCGWLLPGVALAECAARVQVGSVLISPWLAEDLAHGGRLQQSLDVRVSGLQGCAPLLLGVSIDDVPAGTRARVQSAPNGAEVGEAPGGGQPLLSVIGAGGEALLNPFWNGRPKARRWRPAGRRCSCAGSCTPPTHCCRNRWRRWNRQSPPRCRRCWRSS